MKKRVFNCVLLTICLTMATVNVQAQSKPTAEDDAKILVVTVFETVDADSNEALTVEEISAMSESIFVSMDYDDNAKISNEEFMGWDFGLMYISAQAGEEETFSTAKKILFALRDLNSDGLIDQKEDRLNLITDFELGDTNSDGSISQSEYLTSYMPNIVFKAALKRKGK